MLTLRCPKEILLLHTTELLPLKRKTRRVFTTRRAVLHGILIFLLLYQLNIDISDLFYRDNQIVI